MENENNPQSDRQNMRYMLPQFLWTVFPLGKGSWAKLRKNRKVIRFFNFLDFSIEKKECKQQYVKYNK